MGWFHAVLFLLRCIAPTSNVHHMVYSKYGAGTLKSIRHIEKSRKSICKLEHDITFLQRCFDNNLVPHFLSKSKCAVSRLRGSRLHRKHLRETLLDELTHKRQELRDKQREILTSPNIDSLGMSWFDRIRAHRSLTRTLERYDIQVQKTQLKKLLNLGYNELVHPDPDTVIFNLSDRVLSEEERDVLSLGLEYALNPRKILATDFFLPFEKFVNKIKTLDARLLPGEKCSIILNDLKAIAWRHFRKLKESGTRDNISRNQLTTLVNLSKDENIVILKPDKGSGVVILNRSDYTRKMLSILDDANKFKVLNDDILKLITQKEDRLDRFLQKLYKGNVISTQEKSFLSPCGSRPGILYGLPKIHKENCPTRPILSASGTFNYNLSKFIVPLIRPFTMNEYTVSDTFSFLDTISNVKNADDYVMASIDIVSLYTSVPVRETIDILIETAFRENDTFHGFKADQFRELLQLIMDNVFIFDGRTYHQHEGLPMGGPASPPLANAFLCHHETTWISDCPIEYRPVFYKRYVDDTFLLFRNHAHVESFCSFLNTRHPAIKFTSEVENNNTLNFLDINIVRKNNEFVTSVFRKNTFSGLVTNFNSFIPQIFKLNLISVLTFRAWKICSTSQLLSTELNFISDVLFRNGFPRPLIKNQMNRALQKFRSVISPTANVKKDEYYLRFQFYGHISNGIKADLQKFVDKFFPQLKFCPIFCNSFKIRNFFPFKDRLERSMCSRVCYEYQCPNCSIGYIGSTKRHLIKRVREHMGCSPRTGSRLSRPGFSAIRNHVEVMNSNRRSRDSTDNECSISLENFRILATAHNESDLHILEGILIAEKSPDLNGKVENLSIYQ